MKKNPDIEYPEDMGSDAERAFQTIWISLGGPLLEREQTFHDERRWRVDFMHRITNTIIEIEGGIWSSGRHLRPQGYINDCKKYVAAQLEGWEVFSLAYPNMVVDEPEWIERIIKHIRKKEERG